MAGYSTGEVARLVGLSLGQVRAYLREGFLAPEQTPQGPAFSFQDIVLLRTAKGLLTSGISPQRIRRAFFRLRKQLPPGRPLSGVAVMADGRKIVVRDGRVRLEAESGQALFDFDTAALKRRVAPLAKRAVAQARRQQEHLESEDWYLLGCELELVTPQEARDAYRRAVELDPGHADAHVNLGRLLHEDGQTGAAEAHYRLALSARPTHATAAFNLGVALEDKGERRDAVRAYERALHADPAYADAHFNLARLYERLGRRTAALRHFKTYRKLIDGS